MVDQTQAAPDRVAHSRLVGGPKGRHRPQPKRHISGRVVNVRLGLAVSILAALLSAALLAAVIAAPPVWADLVLLVALVPLAAVGGYLGVWGVIRYGLFTEGCGAAAVAAELRLGRLARVGGILAQFSVVVGVAAAIVLLVRVIA